MDTSRHSVTLNVLEDPHELLDLCLLEDSLDAEAVQVGEGALVEQAGVHHSVLGQVVDHHVDELELAGV